MRSLVETTTNAALAEWFEEHPAEARAIINKALQAARARQAARKARDLVRRKTALENSRLPGKLKDCSNNDPAQCELFLVEGNSAGGTAGDARDREFQAILPLRGKILNVEKARINKILSNVEIQAMITTINTGIGEEFNLDGLRYHKIVAMTDADVDGAHIRTLILTFFFRHMLPMIEAGHVYIAQPPALPAQVRPPRGALPPERHRARAHPAARAAGRHRGGRPLRRVAALHRGALPALPLARCASTRAGPRACARSSAGRRSTTSRITA